MAWPQNPQSYPICKFASWTPENSCSAKQFLVSIEHPCRPLPEKPWVWLHQPLCHLLIVPVVTGLIALVLSRKDRLPRATALQLVLLLTFEWQDHQRSRAPELALLKPGLNVGFTDNPPWKSFHQMALLSPQPYKLHQLLQHFLKLWRFGTQSEPGCFGIH